MPQTDEGEVNINAELAVGTRIEPTEAVLLQLEEMVAEGRAREGHHHHERRRRRGQQQRLRRGGGGGRPTAARSG